MGDVMRKRREILCILCITYFLYTQLLKNVVYSATMMGLILIGSEVQRVLGLHIISVRRDVTATLPTRFI